MWSIGGRGRLASFKRRRRLADGGPGLTLAGGNPRLGSARFFERKRG